MESYKNNNYVSKSLTVGVRSEALLVHTSTGQYYFIEYPTNQPPNPIDVFNEINDTVELTPYEFGTLNSAFLEYEELQTKLGYIHAPTYLHGFTKAKGLDLGVLNILL